jgi:hypothetical protein
MLPKIFKILIGRPRGHLGGGIAQFIQYELQYSSLLLRLGLAAAVWLACWLLGWPFPAKLGLFASEIYASLILLRILADVFQFAQLGRILIAMWLPIGVIAVAAYLLFENDQGRELGLGLMDLTARGPLLAVAKGALLALVLIYWALNNWLSARIGVARSFPRPDKDEILLFWGPRLLGVVAHLLAAFSLVAAALSQDDLRGTIAFSAVFTAPLAIAAATAYVWFLDYGFLSQRSDPAWRPAARKWMHVMGAVELLLFVGLAVAWWHRMVPEGFVWGTLCIALSAFAFLGVISWIRRKAPLGKRANEEDRAKDNRFEEKQTAVWAVALVVIMLVGAAAFWLRPMQVSQFFGSLIIAYFSFGSFLSLANLFDVAASRLSRYTGKIGFVVRPAAFVAAFLCLLVLPAFVTSLTQSFHRVRLCNEKECTPVQAPKAGHWSAIQAPAGRPTVTEAARAWYRQAEQAYHRTHPENEAVPMLVVATAGGGIRAAYWTATILEELEKYPSAPSQSPGNQPAVPETLLRNLLFAISGVSGGSIGAAAYAAAVHDHELNGAAITPTSYLKDDFLAPGVASMVFIDGPSNLLPDFGQIDRAQAIERGLEHASRTERDKEGLVSHNFLSFFPDINRVTTLDSWRPVLLFNASHEETGRRIITSHIKIERDVFLDSYDALQVLNSDVRLSTAAHNSARFTYISPAGNLISATEPSHNRGYVIDGGYFENYGAETALELARKAIEAIDPNPNQNKVKLVLLQISSDPSLEKGRTLVRVRQEDGVCHVSTVDPDRSESQGGSQDHANYLRVIDPKGWSKNEGEGFVLSSANELGAPLVGIMSVRQAHGTIAAAELASSICQGKAKVAQALKDPMQRTTTVTPYGAAGGAGKDPPHFSHLAMCKQSWIIGRTGIDPPLGWVLSDRTRDKFKDILEDCGNDAELKSLREALGQ